MAVVLGCSVEAGLVPGKMVDMGNLTLQETVNIESILSSCSCCAACILY